MTFSIIHAVSSVQTWVHLIWRTQSLISQLHYYLQHYYCLLKKTFQVTVFFLLQPFGKCAASGSAESEHFFFFCTMHFPLWMQYTQSWLGAQLWYFFRNHFFRVPSDWAAAAEGQLRIFYWVFLCSSIDMLRLLRHVFPYASAFTSCGVSVGLEGSRYADERREVVTRLIFRVNSGWGIRGCNCLTFTPFSKALSDPRVSVSGWITMIGSEGETEVTGTTRTKTVRNKSSAGRRRRPPSSLKPPHSQCSNIALFIHHCDEQQHKEILYRLILGHCSCKWLPASNINAIALIH